MQVFEHFNLKKLNTFGINANARWFTEISSPGEYAEVLEFINNSRLPVLPIGCGSNMLFTKDYDGLVVKINTKGIKKVYENDQNVIVEAAAGELWEVLIEYCVAEGLYGLENLSGIPGQVGSSPIQNIGAYGAEVKDCIREVVAINLADGKIMKFDNNECSFGYRDSIFKRELKGKVLITNVIFSLSKIRYLNLEYNGVAAEARLISGGDPDLASVSKAVCNIRDKKIPNPKVIGSAGSFFKNPQIDEEQFQELIARFPGIPNYPAECNRRKLAAGWLIEQCGWKGYRKGDAGVNHSQALILVNYGNAEGIEIYDLSRNIQHSVLQKFGIKLETEVNII